MALKFQDLGDIPSLPGVYLFYSNGHIVYVGKSMHLKERVRSYFGKIHEREKLYQMMNYVDDLRFVVTDSHLEARLLEYELIQKHRPIYNSRYTRRKSIVYLRVDESKLLSWGDSGFGPLIMNRGLRFFVKSMVSIYPIRRRKNEFIFEKQILPPKLTEEAREATVHSLEAILYDEAAYESFCEALLEKMNDAAHALAFEQANFYKTLREDLEYIVGQTRKERAFHETPYTFFSERGDQFIVTYRGQIVIKDKVDNRAIYDDYDFTDVEWNPDLEYAKIIYSEAKRLHSGHNIKEAK